MSSNICATQPVGTFQYNPYAMSCCGSDFDYLDIDYSMYPMGMGMCGNPMGMNGSIFGPLPFGGCSGTGTGYSTQDYFNNMKEYQQFYNQYNIDQQKMQRNADLQINGPMEAIREHAENLKDKIEHNEQDQIVEAYNKYIESVKHTYGDGTKEEINSRALAMYNQISGRSLIQDLREHGHSSEVQGFIQALTLGLYATNSAEDNIAKITGQSVPTGEKAKQNIGRVAGAATVGGIAYGLTKFIAANTKTIANGAKAALKGKAGKIGLIAGAAAMALAFITGKMTSSAD